MNETSQAAPADAPIVAVILAGGAAARLGGGDKGLLPLAGRSILQRIVATLRPQACALALNANGDPRRFASLGVPIVADPPGLGRGPLVGILAALRWHPGARVVVTVPTDTPFLPDDLISRLAAALSATGARASVASSAGRIHPVIGAWDPALAPELHHAVSERGMRRAGDWAAAIGAVPVVWPDRPIDPFENLNTPADLATAERLALRTGGDTARSR